MKLKKAVTQKQHENATMCFMSVLEHEPNLGILFLTIFFFKFGFFLNRKKINLLCSAFDESLYQTMKYCCCYLRYDRSQHFFIYWKFAHRIFCDNFNEWPKITCLNFSWLFRWNLCAVLLWKWKHMVMNFEEDTKNSFKQYI